MVFRLQVCNPIKCHLHCLPGVGWLIKLCFCWHRFSRSLGDVLTRVDGEWSANTEEQCDGSAAYGNVQDARRSVRRVGRRPLSAAVRAPTRRPHWWWSRFWPHCVACDDYDNFIVILLCVLALCSWNLLISSLLFLLQQSARAFAQLMVVTNRHTDFADVKLF